MTRLGFGFYGMAGEFFSYSVTAWVFTWIWSSPDCLAFAFPPHKWSFLFHFQAKWLLHPQYESIFQQAWCAPHQCSSMFSLVQKLHSCRTSFTCWKGTIFKGPQALLRFLQQQLEEVYSHPFNLANSGMVAKLTTDIHDLWQQDELHCWQWSHIQWLQAGNYNPKLFHLSTIQQC